MQTLHNPSWRKLPRATSLPSSRATRVVVQLLLVSDDLRLTRPANGAPAP